MPSFTASAGGELILLLCAKTASLKLNVTFYCME